MWLTILIIALAFGGAYGLSELIWRGFARVINTFSKHALEVKQCDNGPFSNRFRE